MSTAINKKVSVKQSELINADVVNSLLSNTMTQNELMSTVMNNMANIPRSAMRSMRVVDLSRLDCAIIDSDDDSVSGESVDNLDIPPVPTTLPAIVSNELRASGVSSVKWANVDDLPGASHQGVLALGMGVFKHFGLSNKSKVKIVASLESGDLINSNLELNSMLHFLENNAHKVSPDNMTIDFQGVIDGYRPEVRLYHTDTHAFLAVFENDGICGRYIYSFERDNTLKIESN